MIFLFPFSEHCLVVSKFLFNRWTNKKTCWTRSNVIQNENKFCVFKISYLWFEVITSRNNFANLFLAHVLNIFTRFLSEIDNKIRWDGKTCHNFFFFQLVENLYTHYSPDNTAWQNLQCLVHNIVNLSFVSFVYKNTWRVMTCCCKNIISIVWLQLNLIEYTICCHCVLEIYMNPNLSCTKPFFSFLHAIMKTLLKSS